MTRSLQVDIPSPAQTAQTAFPDVKASRNAAPSIQRIRSEELFQQAREVEIDHEGRIYRLRLTQLNKLILTA
jgi:hemin uptake protein HemP